MSESITKVLTGDHRRIDELLAALEDPVSEGRWEDARSHLELALGALPDFAPLHRCRALFLSRTSTADEDVELALSSWLRAASLYTKEQTVKKNDRTVLLPLGREPRMEARACIDEARALLEMLGGPGHRVELLQEEIRLAETTGSGDVDELRSRCVEALRALGDERELTEEELHALATHLFELGLKGRATVAEALAASESSIERGLGLRSNQ